MDADRAVNKEQAVRDGIRAMLSKVGVYDQVIAAWLEPLTQAAIRFHITTRLRLIHWLATLVHESAGFTRLEENCNYNAGALLRLWPLTPRRPWGFDAQDAADYARQPEKIANRIYADRMGNGNEASGEGWFYRGRGPLQITGRAGYQAASGPCGVDLLPEPDLLKQPKYGAIAAAEFWSRRGCNELADHDNTVEIRHRVNGGELGLSEVSELVLRMKFA